MDKMDFFRAYSQYDRFQDHVFDYWVYWSEKRGVDHKTVMSRITNEWTFDLDYENGCMIVTHKDGKDHVPLDTFWEEKEYPDIKMLWHSEYWDGPLSGMCLFNNVKYWFKCESMEYDDGVRTFALYKLSDEEIEYEEHWHTIWREMAGSHCDYGENYAPYDGRKTTSQFYELAKRERKPRDYTNNEKLGVFDECLFDRSRR